MGIIETFLAVAQKVGLLAILIFIGFLCQRIKFLNEQTNKNLANIVMYFVTPCVIVNSFRRAFDMSELGNLDVETWVVDKDNHIGVERHNVTTALLHLPQNGTQVHRHLHKTEE